jgi:hypothetical protein
MNSANGHMTVRMMNSRLFAIIDLVAPKVIPKRDI